MFVFNARNNKMLTWYMLGIEQKLKKRLLMVQGGGDGSFVMDYNVVTVVNIVSTKDF